MKFILLTTQRTGSTWVIDMLHSHPQIVAYSELFLAAGEGERPSWGGAKDLVFWHTFRERACCGSHPVGGDEPRLLRAYLDQVFAPRPGVRAVGFKVMYEQLGNAGLGETVAAQGLRVIHLTRDPIDVFVSRSVAQHTGVYHRRNVPPAAWIPVTIDPVELLAHLDRYQSQVAATRSRWVAAECPYLEVSYEWLLARASAFDPVLEFLGAERGVRLSSTLERTSASRWRDQVQNRAQLEAAVAGTPHEHLLAF